MQYSPSSKYPRLFEPFELAGKRIRNRIVHAAFSTSTAKAGDVTDRLINHGANRARGGIGMYVTESILSDDYDPTLGRVQAFKEERFDSLKRWADAIESEDCRIIGQLFNLGRASLWGPHRGAIGVSANADHVGRTVPHVLSRDQIHDLVEQHSNTAERLKRAGFSGVEISSAHAFLYLQFLSPYVNRREDEYGGDVVGRTRFAREVLQAIRDKCGSDFIVGYKLPATDEIKGSIDPEESEAITRQLRDTNTVDYFCYSQGNLPTLEMHSPDMHQPRGTYLHLNTDLKKAAGDVPVIAVGRIITPEQAEQVLANEQGDMVAMARPFLADPAWALKAKEGRAEDIRPCTSCNQCWNDFLRGYGTSCFYSPNMGRSDELEWQPTPAKDIKRIAVVGSGVAGMHAATLAAQRGHDVTLYGRSNDLGGKVLLHAKLPGCSELKELCAYQIRQARKTKITFKLGSKVDAQTLINDAPNAVVLATGSTMTSIEEFRPDSNLVDLRSVVFEHLSNQKLGGKLLVVYDIDQTSGTYAAIELLADRYEKIVLLTPADSICRDEAYLYQRGVFHRLYELGVQIIPHVRPVSLSNKQLTYANLFTDQTDIIDNVDLFTFSTARSQDDELAKPLCAAGMEVHTIGDCHQPLGLITAMHSAHALANKL